MCLFITYNWQILFYNANLMSITLILHFFSFTLLSLFPVLQRSVRHHRPVWQEDHEHADVVLWRSARVLRHAQLPHRYQQPVCDPAETWAPGCSDRPCRALQVDQFVYMYSSDSGWLFILLTCRFKSTIMETKFMSSATTAFSGWCKYFIICFFLYLHCHCSCSRDKML